MKLRSLSRYFYRHPKALFNGTFILSVVLHAAMLIQIPFLKFMSLPAQKGKITIINVSLEEVKVHSKTNIVKKKKKPEEEKKKLFKEMVKKDEAMPYLKKEEFIPPPPSVSKDIIIKARETYKDKILKRINVMKHYPMLARRRGQKGGVKVEFTLNNDGRLKDEVAIIRKCRHEVLNEAAVKTIVRANPYPPFPHVIKKDEMAFIVEVDFRLEAW